MTNRVSKLILAAVLLSSIPLAASACDRDDDAPRAAWPPAVVYGYQQPDATYLAYPEPPRPREWTDGREDGDWREGHEGREWRERRAWRERELADVSAQLRSLDAQRDRFYAENAWRPGRVRRFDRWYASRRAELERRWYELQPLAWR